MREKEPVEIRDCLVSGWKPVEILAEKYSIPAEEIVLIALNASGVSWRDIKNGRIRFPLLLYGGNQYFFALTATDSPLAPFHLEESGSRKLLKFDGRYIGEIPWVENDTCTDSYWRRGKKDLTLNSNSRSRCRGCRFCGTYSLEEEDPPLTEKNALEIRAQDLAKELGEDLSGLESVGIVTGCFPTEKDLFNHLLLVREVFGKYGFSGELRYVGSQLRDPSVIKEIISTGPFSYYLTVEAFTRREQLMKRVKASLSLEEGREILFRVKELGGDTSYLYIVGLDPLDVIEEELPKYKGVLTRFPHAQIFQIYQPHQISLRCSEASSLEYFLRARLLFEENYPDLVPDRYLNYRGLWYSSYRGNNLPRLEHLSSKSF